MERNQYGVNFDQGVPLSTDDDFKLLYLNIVPEKNKRLIGWIEKDSADPVIVAGQIGTGKTTFIAKAFSEAKQKIDVTLSFDTDIPFSNAGAFWGFFLGKILRYAQNLNMDLSSFKIESVFCDRKKTPLKELIELLICPADSVDLYDTKKKLYIKADDRLDAVQHIAETIIPLIEERQAMPISFFAEGIDKFFVYRSDYFSIFPLLNFLCRYKTLFEANLIHILGGNDEWLQKNEKIIINHISTQHMSVILEKRMGVYARGRQEIFPLISELSGGNIRQGLRLLMEYDYANGQLKKNRIESMHYASQRVRNDFLNIPAGRINPDLLNVINRDKYVKAGLVSGLSEGDDVRSAIYGNWILVTDEPNESQNWPALINPLILPGLTSVKKIPDSLETQLIKNWAEQHDISPFGLEIDRLKYDLTEAKIHDGTRNHDDAIDHNVKFFNEVISLQYHCDTLTISEIFNSMASFIMNHERKDKIIIAYQKKEIVELANDYILGRAGRYSSIRFNEIGLNTGSSKNFLMTLIENLDDKRFEAYSVYFNGKMNHEQIVLFEKKRDHFLNFKMIWWIDDALLRTYLPSWTQLRQFFYIFRLEQDILGNISATEIKQDLEILKQIRTEAGAEEHMKKLKTVLKYLGKRKQHGNA